MKEDNTLPQMPSSYTELVIEKSNLLLRANMLDAQHQFDEAAELFAASAHLEFQLASTAQQYERNDIALTHLISEMSCWAAAGDTYRALSKGRQVLKNSTLTPAQRTHVSGFVEKLNRRRRSWMESWTVQASATA